MSGSPSRKPGMRFSFRLSDMRIRTKLLTIIALIVTVFLMIVLTVVVSFHRIENVLGGVISDDMNNVITNALTEREMTSIVADLNLLLGTFFEDEAHLHKFSKKRYLIYIENEEGTMVWKAIDDMPCIVEYDLKFD